MIHPREKVSWSVFNTQTWKYVLEIPFNPLDWDDFLDLSKMKSPETIGVLTLRTKRNFFRYKDNYLVIYFSIWLLTGIALECKYLLSLMTMFCFWIFLCFYHVNPNFIATKQYKLSCVSLPKKYNALEVEMIIEFLAGSHFILFVTGILYRVYLLTFLILIPILAHSFSRPVAIEIHAKHTTEKFRSNPGSFHSYRSDENDEEDCETIEFSNEDTDNINDKSSSKIPFIITKCKKRGKITDQEEKRKSLIIPLAREM